jgi:hypothetical protein
LPIHIHIPFSTQNDIANLLLLMKEVVQVQAMVVVVVVVEEAGLPFEKSFWLV